MRQLIVLALLVCSFSILSHSTSSDEGNAESLMYSTNQDTCIIEGMVFKFVKSKGPQKLKAIIKNGHIEIITSKKNENYRIIRYIFSVSPYERLASVVRNYGSLVSYPVILDLKQSSTGDRFYFENIVVVDPQKQILNNAVKPIIIERVK